MKAMLRPLLARALGLAYHVEHQPSPVFRLVVGRNSPKFRPGTAGSMTMQDFAAGTYRFDSVDQLVQFLNSIYYLGGPAVPHPVENGTGLTGHFNIRLDLGENNGPPTVALMPLVKEQLGLDVVQVPGHTDYLVIDKIDHPTGKWTWP